MARVRTFIAIDVNDEIRAAGQRIIAALRQSTAGMRWVRPENIHLTLKFLGDVDERELHNVCQHAGQAAAATHPFSVTCRSLGAFPSVSKANTIWMGIDDENRDLAGLQKHVEAAMAKLGFPSERRKYHGHLTLGRIRSSRGNHRELRQLLENSEEKEFGLLAVQELTVYQSELSRDGPHYTVVGRCPLGSNL